MMDNELEKERDESLDIELESQELEAPEQEMAEASSAELISEEVSELEFVEEKLDDDNKADELEDFEADAIEEIEYLEDLQVLSILESILFASDKPQGIGAFKQVFKGTNIDTSKIKKSLEALKIEYAGGNRGVTLEETTGGYQLRTKSDNMVFIKRMIKGRTFKLSGPALEVLSIVAYKQPCIKSDVDEIRGVESGHILRGLMDRGMVSFAGKSELPGKPMLYATSRKFLEIFGLRNLGELPSLSEIDELLPEGIEDQVEEKQTLDQLTDQLSKDAVETYSEGEEELGKITEKLSEISSSTEFFEMEKQRQKQERDTARAQDIEDALTVGEDVPGKDIKWLEKYKQSLQEAEQMAEANIEATPSEETFIATGTEVSGGIEMEEDINLETEKSVEEEGKPTGPIAATGLSDEVSFEESPSDEEQKENQKKIGEVDISSLKDDLDFLA